MPRIRLTLAYEGTQFHGWQVQDVPEQVPRTVQGVVEKALARIAEHPLRVHGSGRTDTGVHALAQIAHFDAPEAKAHIPWKKALNALMSEDVRVLDAESVPGDFHARYSSVSKTYAYSFWVGGRYVLPQRRNFTWHPGALDIPAMEEAATMLMGTHDFAAFQNTGTEVASTVRTLTELAPGEVQDLGAIGGELVWRISADGFLKQMARNIFGLLAAIGRRKFPPAEAANVLACRDRTIAGYATAPARGLTLVQVRYE